MGIAMFGLFIGFGLFSELPEYTHLVLLSVLGTLYYHLSVISEVRYERGR
jgi:hypothetical protein